MTQQQAGKHRYGWRRLVRLVASAALAVTLAGASSAAAQTPAVGSKAPGFSAMTPAGQMVKLVDVNSHGSVVLIFLRGYPGYQCPYCVKQVHDFIEHAAAFQAAHASVLFVYPGPPAELDTHAKEFLTTQEAELPSGTVLVTDPDYAVTNNYHLRWDAPHETAYPSTFILNGSRTILFEKISHSHVERTTADETLGQLKSK